MKTGSFKLPFPYNMANALGKPLAAAGVNALQLDEASIREKAVKETGLHDFGDPYYEEGFTCIVESADRDANLHPLGRFMARDIITNYLAQRLWLAEKHNEDPDLFAEPIHPPLIITGPARSGTTFLHNLLALDEAHRALPMWQLMHPFPAWEGDGEDPRRATMERTMRFRAPLLPGIDAKHYTEADAAEECLLALGLTFKGLIFPTLIPATGYMEWYLEQEDHEQKYREYRWLLSVFQAEQPALRLALKAPDHLSGLEALIAAVPEAMIVQTHRDPVPCVTSTCSLIYTYYQAMTTELDVRYMVELTLRLFETWYRRSLTFREAHPDRVFDVPFDELVTDPVGVVRGIYSHYSLPWSAEKEATLQAYIARNPENKHGRHTYSADDFGLSEAQIREHLPVAAFA